jgi:glycosyltransferase involved in cell wall biosynthesis
MRLGVFSDIRYRFDGESLSTHQAFVRFVTSLPPRVDEVVLFGRLDPEAGRSHYVLPRERVRFVPLPHYARVTAVAAQVRQLRATRAAFRRELASLDAVWIFGPHPVAVALAWTARSHGIPLFLGVRQQYVPYIAGRLPNKRWAWAIGVAYALEFAFRRLARSAPTVAVGDEIAHAYGAGRAAVLTTGFSLIREADIVSADEVESRDWDGDLSILSVGRLDPEKNPLLLLDVLDRVLQASGRWRLTVVGEGQLEEELRGRAAALGLEHAVEFVGYVPQGDELRDLYRRHHAFLHVSLTEGLPQVLFEAHAAGLATVATEVGGVGPFVRRTRSALLVPPADADAAARALRRLAEDSQLRSTLVANGLATVRSETMEQQLDRIAAFFRASLGRELEG